MKTLEQQIAEIQSQLREREALLNKAAAEASFVYCAAVIQDGVEMPRNGYGEGWNAAMAKITKILKGQDDEAWVIKEAYDRLEADCAAKREALLAFQKVPCSTSPPIDDYETINGYITIADCKRGQQALSTDAGKSLLDRLQAVESLLTESSDLLGEFAAFGNCDCDIPNGKTCEVCQAAMLQTRIKQALQPAQKEQ